MMKISTPLRIRTRASHAGLLLGGLLSATLPARPGHAQALTVTALTPTRNAVAAPRTTPVAVTFSQPLSGAASPAPALRVFSQQAGGLRAGAATSSGSTLTFTPASPFKAGETVQATASAGGAATPYVFQFTTATAPSTAVLAGGAEVSVGGPPVAVVAGDVDGDGDLDMVTANPVYPNASTVSVRLNNGAGSFSAGSQFKLGTGAYTGLLTLGDIDGDGDLDLLVSGLFSGGLVYVQRNDGAGNFSAASTISMFAGVGSLVLGDVDGDGDLDLLAMQPIPGVVSVRLNAGNGTFGAGQDFTLGPTETAFMLAVGDLDSDGDLDLAITALYDNILYVGYNGGKGVFSFQAQIGPGGLLGDIDGDGALDLVGSGGVRLNTGKGDFSAARQFDVNASALGDFDGDGDLDALVTPTSLISNTLSVRLNDGHGTFAPATPFATLAAGLAPYDYGEATTKQVALADLNGDGTLDLLAASGSTVGVSVRFNPLLATPGPIALPSPVAAIRLRAGGGELATTTHGSFTADQYYSASSQSGATTTAITGTLDPALYQSERFSTNGTLSYAVPVANGQYQVVLHFAELYWTKPGQRVFDVSLEGSKVLDHYDIVQRVGPRAAITETFPVTVADGVLNLDLRVPYTTGGADQAKISALEILPITPTARLHAGGGELATSRGTFAADQYYSVRSAILATTAAIAGTLDPALYQSERFSTNGTLSYAVPVANGQYQVVLHFAELYWTKPGQRVFDVNLEGSKVLDHYDIVQRVGPRAAITETFPVTVADGVLNLDLRVPYTTGGADQAKISALEVLQLSASSPVATATTSSLRTALASLADVAPASLATYPNPSPGAFTLTYTAAAAQVATLLLTDPMGRVMHQQAVLLQAGANQVAVQPSALPEGLYRLTLRLANGQRSSQQVAIQP